MGNAIGDILPLAIAIVLSPFPIIGLILILFTKRARINSLFFLLGWIVGLAVVAAVVIALVNAGRISAGSESTEQGASLLQLLLGLALIFFGFREWKARPKVGEVVATPKWMETIDSIGPGGTFGLAFLLSGVNPKNLLINVGAAVIIGQAPLDTTQTVIVTTIYILIASISILGLVVYYQVAGENAEKVLTSMKAWLIKNNTAVMAVLLFVFGAKFVGDFISGIF